MEAQGQNLEAWTLEAICGYSDLMKFLNIWLLYMPCIKVKIGIHVKPHMSRCNNLVVTWEADLNQCIGTPFNPLRVLLILILLYYKVEIENIKGHFRWSNFRFSINKHQARPILRKILSALNNFLNLLEDLEFCNNLWLTALRKISNFTYKSHLIESLFVKSLRQTLIVNLGMISHLISHY